MCEPSTSASVMMMILCSAACGYQSPSPSHRRCRCDGGDHGSDFVVLQNLVEARFLHVDQFARMGRIAWNLRSPLLGRATRKFTLHM